MCRLLSSATEKPNLTPAVWVGGTAVLFCPVTECVGIRELTDVEVSTCSAVPVTQHGQQQKHISLYSLYVVAVRRES